MTQPSSASVCCWTVHPDLSKSGAPIEETLMFLTGTDLFGEGDFGGNIEPFETPEEAAARETFEETLGSIVGFVDQDTLLRDLRDSRFSLRLDFRVGYDSSNFRLHRTFVKRVLWDHELIDRFRQRRQTLLDAQMADSTKKEWLGRWGLSSLSNVPCALEKSELQWRSLKSLMIFLREGGGPLRPCAVPLLSVVIHQFFECGMPLTQDLPFVTRKRSIRWFRDWTPFVTRDLDENSPRERDPREKLDTSSLSNPPSTITIPCEADALYTLRFDSPPFLRGTNNNVDAMSSNFLGDPPSQQEIPT